MARRLAQVGVTSINLGDVSLVFAAAPLPPAPSARPTTELDDEQVELMSA